MSATSISGAGGRNPRRSSYTLLDSLPESESVSVQTLVLDQNQDHTQSSSQNRSQDKNRNRNQGEDYSPMLMHIPPYMGPSHSLSVGSMRGKGSIFQCGGEEGDGDESDAEPGLALRTRMKRWDGERVLYDEPQSMTPPPAPAPAPAPSLPPLVFQAIQSTRPAPSRRRTSRRWSSAVTNIADDVEFLRELDRQLRTDGRESIGLEDLLASPDVKMAGGNHEHDGEGEEGTSDDHEYNPYKEVEVGLLDTMKRAMMCVREIVRTERSYLAHLMSAREREVSIVWLFVF